MSLDISSLSDSAVQTAEDTLTALIKEEYPALDLTAGRVFKELLIKPAAIFYAFTEKNIEALRTSLSLIASDENPELVDAEIAEDFFANLRITKTDGTTSSGQLTIVMAVNATTIISMDTEFSINDTIFKPTQTFIGMPSVDDDDADNIRQITQRADQMYEFVIDVVASVEGTAGNIQQGTRLTVSPESTRIVDVYATDSFTGGTNTESIEDLITRGKEALSPKVLCTRLSDTALLKSEFGSAVDISVIGYGDPEMTRDQHNIFSISSGGKIDIYTRSESIPTQETLLVDCTLVNKTEKLLGFTLDTEQSAGVYKILSVLQENAVLYPQDTEVSLYRNMLGSLEIVNNLRQFSLGDEDIVPDITTAQEAAFSAYQTFSVQFLDPGLNTLNLSDGDIITYKVIVLRMPQIHDIQEYVNLRSVRNYCSDVLIKAAIPCICSLTVVLRKRSNETATIDEDAIKTAIANYINSHKFADGPLSAAKMIEAVQTNIPALVNIDLPLDLSGMLLLPSGDTKYLHNTDCLNIADILTENVSSRTVAFFISTNDIDIDTVTLTNREV